ncbi:MAG TPA: hypothetical protein VJJ75_03315 [Candidatus Nanoarchaeia archaeon]|nr:hypothetical protein [Candidatus Nanoarchaeia archaeon]
MVINSRIQSFKIKFKKLKIKTKNFSNIKPDIFLEDQRYISVFRVITGRTINVDFLISKKGMPKVVVECTTTESPGKKYSYNLKRKIYETDYRFTKIKIKYPKIKTVFILSLPKNDLWEYRLRKLINMQTLSIDNTFINGDLKLLPNLVIQEAIKQ